MIVKENNSVKIICDKCGKSQVSTEENYNDDFYKNRWALNKGRKYMHLCFNCLPSKYKKTFAK